MLACKRGILNYNKKLHECSKEHDGNTEIWHILMEYVIIIKPKIL